jgi:hypothetical protein
MSSADSRSLTTTEKARLEYLLSADFPGVAALREQAKIVRAVDTAEDQTILFRLPDEVVAAEVISPQPVLGACETNEYQIELELFVPSGRLFLMGFIFVPPPIERVLPPSLDELSVYVREPRNGPYRMALAGTLPSRPPFVANDSRYPAP